MKTIMFKAGEDYQLITVLKNCTAIVLTEGFTSSDLNLDGTMEFWYGNAIENSE